MFSRKPGDPRTVQVYQYNVVKGANGWKVYRNSQLDKTVTRVEGKNWKGAEESHFSVFKNGKWNDYESYTDFSKDYPKHNLQGMPAKEIAKLSAWATKEVAYEAVTNPESSAVLFAPVSELIFAKLIFGCRVVQGAQTVRKVGAGLKSVEEIMENPSLLQGKSLSYVKEVLNETSSSKWVNDVMRKSSRAEGWMFRELNKAGTDYTVRIIQYHPGSPRHFDRQAYWKVSNGIKGTVRVVATN
ncbi:hypothetical protein OF897_17390 [Chryseobacterium formosus]|uniref:RES domain-containing protein n=1 Tax=Chryseobacterium formosus TaxID=1537363 RepID=A0ABT3XVI3_9FLAO|nr:hypothetical protein [Chryseobacterium formosus]MCX8525692.1 hypothetical protein [Chryseobacterium formosus]